MKNSEIMESLKNGATIQKIQRMIFKRNKLKRGIIVEYSINGNMVKRPQFEKIEHLLTKVLPEEGAYTHYKMV
jgi:hypothetical protein